MVAAASVCSCSRLQSNAVTGDIGHYIMTQCLAFPHRACWGTWAGIRVYLPVFRDLDFSVSRTKTYGAKS